MLGYCTLGTNDLKASAEFYEPIAKILGHGRVMESDRTVMWGTPDRGAMFCLITPYDGEAANPGNGTMFGFLFVAIALGIWRDMRWPVSSSTASSSIMIRLSSSPDCLPASMIVLTAFVSRSIAL